MKSMIRGAALGLAVVLSAQAAHAQGLSFGVGGGAVVPTGTMSEGISTGWSLMAVARVKPPAAPIGFQVDAFYDRFGFEVGEGHSRMIGATANALYAFPSVSPVRPYLLGGAGVYNAKASVEGAESSTKFGLNAGAGFDFALGSANLFTDARFHMIFNAVAELNGTTVEEKAGYMIPITLGLRF